MYFMSNSNKHLVAPVWISYAEGETKEKEQLRRLMNGVQDMQERTALILNLFQNITPPPYNCEWNEHQNHSSSHSSLIKHYRYLWTLLVFLTGRQKTWGWHRSVTLIVKKGGFNYLRCAFLNIKEEKNTNSSSLFQ